MKTSIPLPVPHSSTPWYREPWPWILIALPACAVLAGIATLMIAMSNQDGLVVEDYYKQGLTINRRLEREQRAAALGLQAQVTVQGHAAIVRLVGNASPSGIIVSFLHPTRTGFDREVPARRLADGSYLAAVPELGAGRRIVQIEDLERSWRLTGEWTGEREFALHAIAAQGEAQ
jgi:hypothetical protein